MIPATLYLAIVVCTLGPAEALSSHITNCTLPSANVTSGFYYVSVPNVRGSLDIFWLCLSTLVICSYKVLHFNITPGRRYSILKTFAWSLVAIMAPEIVLSECMGDLRMARKRLRDFKASTVWKSHPMEWTLTHMFYANAYGFILQTDGEDETLNAKLLLKRIEEGGIGRSPPLTREEIMDKSKEDSFTKSLAIIQIIYFYVEFFTRIGQKKAVSQLELSVASIAMYSLVSYLCVWHKPKGVETPTYISATQSSKREPRIDQSLANEERELAIGSSPYSNFEQAERLVNKEPVPEVVPTEEGDPMPPVRKPTTSERLTRGVVELKTATYGKLFVDTDRNNSEFYVLFFASIPLGAVHLAAWNFDFPSTPDKWLWRSSSIVCTAVLPVSTVFICIFVALDAFMVYFMDNYHFPRAPRWIHDVKNKARAVYSWLKNAVDITFFIPSVVILGVYLISRIILTVECIRCLFFLPASAFQITNWAASIPHFG